MKKFYFLPFSSGWNLILCSSVWSFIIPSTVHAKFVKICVISWNYSSLIRHNEFSWLSWLFIAVNVVILNRIGIIIKNVLISWSNSIWGLAEKRGNYSSRKRVMSNRKKSLDVCFIRRKERNMETLPLMALLPGVRPILGQLPGYLYPREYKSTGHWQTVTGHPTTDRPSTFHARLTAPTIMSDY